MSSLFYLLHQEMIAPLSFQRETFPPQMHPSEWGVSGSPMTLRRCCWRICWSKSKPRSPQSCSQEGTGSGQTPEAPLLVCRVQGPHSLGRSSQCYGKASEPFPNPHQTRVPWLTGQSLDNRDLLKSRHNGEWEGRGILSQKVWARVQTPEFTV